MEIVRKRDITGTGGWYYQATLHGASGQELVRATGASRKEAKGKADAEVLAVLEHYSNRAYYRAPNGALFEVSFRYGGWGYQIISPEGKPGCTCGIDGDFKDACEAAEKHAAGYE